MTIFAKSTWEEGPTEPLGDHTINDIVVGRALVNNLPFGSQKKKKIASDLDSTLAFHDVGKAASGFQASLHHIRWGHRHEILSAVAAISAGMKDEIIFSVITHHKTLPSDGGAASGSSNLPRVELPYENHINEVWEKMSAEWYENLEDFNEEWRKICAFIGREYSSLNLNTHLSSNIMNWLGRNDQIEHFSLKQRQYMSLLRGLTITADHIASSGSDAPTKIPNLSDYNLTPSKPYNYQIKVGKKIGSLVLQSPTGSGKTEAALMWTQRNQEKNGRLFYTLPTTASINAMYLRLKNNFKDEDNRLVGLLHSRVASSIYSMLEESDSIKKQATAKNFKSLAREMYFPIRVCTPHQVLKFTLFGKGWELMLSEFPHSVFVFDEIHAYNPKLVGLTMATAKYIVKKGGSAMFLSATLPRFLRRIIRREIPNIRFLRPSKKSDKKILEQKRHILEIVEGNILSNLDFMIEEAEKANSTLVVCNHVPTSQRIYQELVNKIGEKDIVLLHSQFCRRDRDIIEKDLLRSKLDPTDSNYKPLPKILIATQVIEVSLDLDFEQGFIEPSPIDAMVQRLGRINRYANREPAKVRIFRHQLSKDGHVYTEDLRNRSLNVLSELGLIGSPLGEEKLQEAADQVYGNGYDHDDRLEYNEGLNCIQINDMIAGTNRDWVDDIIADNEGGIEILPEPLLDEYNIKQKEHLVIEASSLCVSIGRWRLPQLLEQNQIIYLEKKYDPPILIGCKYSQKLGLVIN